MPKPVLLATDIVLYVLLVAIALYARHARRTTTLAQTWRIVAANASAMSAAIVLGAFVIVAVLDSIHFRPLLPTASSAGADAAAAYSTSTLSLLDQLLAGPRESRERTYSVPFGTHQYSKESALVDGRMVREFPRLQFGGVHLRDPNGGWFWDVTLRSAAGLIGGAVGAAALWLLVAGILARSSRTTVGESLKAIWQGTTTLPWRSMLWTAAVLWLFVGWIVATWPYYHVFGTDQTGNDILFEAIKSVRTAVVIGSLATLATLPFAILFGILAGYYKGHVDDAIQYLYTVLSSIPSVLLIAAFVLMIQAFIDNNPGMFETGLERADIRLLLLSAILGVTGWASLARLLRAETLKLAELDYVQAARAFGVSNATIMKRHILPNVMHVVLIVAVLDFSGLVLYEAVLSYVGVGVDPTTNSFGTMINSARTELSRDPNRLVEPGGGFRLYGGVRPLDAALRQRRAGSIRPARPSLSTPTRARPTSKPLVVPSSTPTVAG